VVGKSVAAPYAGQAGFANHCRHQPLSSLVHLSACLDPKTLDPSLLVCLEGRGITGIPIGYSVKSWDPTERPIIRLGSVFDANSLGK
jgi:hypothetical protein